MAKKSIFSNDIPIPIDPNLDSSNGGTETTEKTTLGKSLQKFADSKYVKPILESDTVTSIKREANGTFESFKDRFTFKNKRQDGGDGDFIVGDVSIANRHRDAISGILNGTFNGNLFDAGVSALNLINFGTKWKIFYDQYVNKDMWSFRYKYYSITDGLLSNNEKASETDGGYVEFLNSLEDPTVLGFSTKINYETSPLFKSAKTFNEKGSETGGGDIILPGDNSASGFITRYSKQHRELVMCQEYLDEFTESIKKIFEAPETISEGGRKYKEGYKNHYIYEIKGLDKLDNPFVEYGETNEKHEALEILLGEDVRMYTNKLKFLYKNLTWSYNMGKKLIPENKLRFDLYIKVSDIRDFTSKNNGLVRNSYSRVIYELKDCEFLFDTSLNPSSLKVGGFNGVNEDYANLSIKIKYRKVNRIFYSRMFGNDNGGIGDMYIGDKFYESNNEDKGILYSTNYATELKNWGFSPSNTKKRDEKSNNIDVEESVSSRLDRLRNGGLFVGEDNNDTALNRFAKGIGNEAVKAGASLVDEGLQKVKDNLNNQQSAVDGLFANNFAGSVRDFLDGNTGKKTTELGDLHPTTNSSIIEPNRDLHPQTNQPIVSPNDDLHPQTNQPVVSPNDDLHPNVNQPIVSPNDDLHPQTNQPIVSPNDDLHPQTNQPVVSPNDDLHPQTNQPVVSPNDDLHPQTNQPIVSPNDDLHPNVNQPIVSPNDDLHPNVNQPIVSPNDDLHPQTNQPVVSPNDDKHPNVNQPIVSPNDDKHPNVNQPVVSPNDDLHPQTNQPIVSPNDDLHPNVNGTVSLNEVNINGKPNSDITSPNEDVHPQTKKGIDSPKPLSDNFSKFIRKDPSQDKARNPDEDCED